MVTLVREAVEEGEYASRSEVIRDALRDWTLKRSLRRKGIEQLRGVWRQATDHPSPGAPPDEVLDQLERKYGALADRTGR